MLPSHSTSLSRSLGRCVSAHPCNLPRDTAAAPDLSDMPILERDQVPFIFLMGVVGPVRRRLGGTLRLVDFLGTFAKA